MECKEIFFIHSFPLLFVVGEEFAWIGTTSEVGFLDSTDMCDVFAMTMFLN
jgi:hypothetical protein